jgi:hypothetical protein
MARGRLDFQTRESGEKKTAPADALSLKPAAKKPLLKPVTKKPSGQKRLLKKTRRPAAKTRGKSTRRKETNCKKPATKKPAAKKTSRKETRDSQILTRELSILAVGHKMPAWIPQAGFGQQARKPPRGTGLI